MRVFIDFEASSLAQDSYPIEVGWVFEDGASEAHLIKPASRWIDWDKRAERIHGISRRTLQAEGASHVEVANRVLEALGPHKVYASAPSWDGKWLSVLLRAAKLPGHALRLLDTDKAQAEAAREALGPVTAPADLDAAIADVIERARRSLSQEPVKHRALDDAERERRLWLEVRRLAAEAAGGAVSA